MPKINSRISIKNKNDLAKMAEGGKKLRKIKEKLQKDIKMGVSAAEIEKLANDLIFKSGGKPSFKMVKDYKWATCININAGVVHGIPHPEIIFQKGDIVSVDIGFYYKEFHTDTSFSVGINLDKRKSNFLKDGQKAFDEAVIQTIVGNKIYDISEAIEKSLKSNDLFPVRALVGHGIGKNLHEEPQIPCFASGDRSESPDIVEGMVLAVEIMYTKGDSSVITEEDGWTIATKSGKISALFEETVAVSRNGPLIITGG